MKTFKKIFFKLVFFVPNYILDIWIFELRSWLGRTFTGRLKLDKTKINLINLGCGPTILKEFINIDFFFNPRIDFGADFRHPLRIDSSVIDGIFCEHTIEHLTYKQDDLLFKECYRILKSGATFRINVPDVSYYAINYANGNKEWFKEFENMMMVENNDLEWKNRKLTTPMEAISIITQEFLHVSCWDFETLKYYLEKNGFSSVKKVAHKQGVQKNLIVDADYHSRTFASLYVEAIK